MSLSDLSIVDSITDLPPAAASRLESAQASAHTAIALLIGTFVASPVLVAALAGRQDVVVALALYLVALVGAWIAVGLFAGAFAMAGRARRRVTTTDEPSTRRAAPPVAATTLTADAGDVGAGPEADGEAEVSGPQGGDSVGSLP